MKQGKHPHKKLTNTGIQALREPKRYADGNGLYLDVKKSVTKSWVMRLVLNGRRIERGLGGYPAVSLAEARDMAVRAKRIAREGGDPFAKKEVIQVPTFEELAYRKWNDEKAGFKNEKYKNDWINSLKNHVFDDIGHVPVDQLEAEDGWRVLKPIWFSKKETASRVRYRMKKVMTLAKPKYRKGNPFGEDLTDMLPKQNKKVQSFEALDWKDIISFVDDLHNSDLYIQYKLAVEFTILNVLRGANVRFAEWEWVDFENATMTIPADQMKRDHDFKVPLANRSIQILQQMHEWTGHGRYIFTQQRKYWRPMDVNTIYESIQKVGYKGMEGRPPTAHGMRATFRTWVAEYVPNYNRFEPEAVRKVLAHREPNKAWAVYNRGDKLESRRQIMDAWAAYVHRDPAESVVHINKGSA